MFKDSKLVKQTSLLLYTKEEEKESGGTSKQKIMKAIIITTPGGPEVLQLQEVEDPQPKDNEVLIRVHATALNSADTVQRKGSYPVPQGASPYPGLECSGTIESVGKNVSKWKIGDQVYSFFIHFFSSSNWVFFIFNN